MAEYTPIDIELGEFSRQTNNLPARNTGKLRNRYMRWKNWRRSHPYEEILDEEANREINSESWTEEHYQENPPLGEGFEDVPLEDFAPEVEVPPEIAETVIDVGETTGLLEGAAGGATLGAGSIAAETAGTAATAVGTALLGGGAAVIGGTVGKVLENAWSGKGAVLPGSEYIGPGNPIHIGPARNPADQVAREHDLGYDDLVKNPFKKRKTFHEQVQDLDNTAIKDFDKAYEETGNINAKIGSIGLGIKRKVEDTLGYPLYPKQPSKYCN